MTGNTPSPVTWHYTGQSIVKYDYMLSIAEHFGKIDRFQPDGDAPPVIVYNYYKLVKNYEIIYPKLPLLVVGSKGALVPIEVSFIGVICENVQVLWNCRIDFNFCLIRRDVP